MIKISQQMNEDLPKNNYQILVTGSAGFIGFHLVNYLVALGYQVIGLDSINDYYDVSLKYNRLVFAGIGKEKIQYNRIVESEKYPNYRFIQLNLEDKSNLDNLFKSFRFDRVCHLAAQAGVRYSLSNPDAYIQSNIVGFTNIMEASRYHAVSHFVYASSSSVYGLNEKMPLSTTDNVDHPISLYAASKKANELIAHTYSYLFDIPTTGLRFFTVYGPWGRPDMALFLFTKNILEGKPIHVFNFGNMTRDFTYIDDIVDGIVRVIENIPEGDPSWDGSKPNPSSSKARYRIYNIGNSNPVKLKDFIKAIEEYLGKKAKIELMPIQAGDVPMTFADTSALVKDLGYKPGTPVTKGIAQFIDWYRKYYNV